MSDQPQQPLEVIDGVVRFKRNKAVWMLVNQHPADPLSYLYRKVGSGEIPSEDYRQFMQLIGYSVSGYGDLAYSDDEDEEWQKEADALDLQAAAFYQEQVYGQAQTIDSGSMNPSRWPTLNESVHYVSYGSPGGEYTSQCRAADVTEVLSAARVSLFVKNPSGIFFDRDKPHAGPDPLQGGTWHYESECTGGSRPTMAE